MVLQRAAVRHELLLSGVATFEAAREPAWPSTGSAYTLKSTTRSTKLFGKPTILLRALANSLLAALHR